MKSAFKTVALVGKYKSPEVAAPLLKLARFLERRKVEVLMDRVAGSRLLIKGGLGFRSSEVRSAFLARLVARGIVREHDQLGMLRFDDRREVGDRSQERDALRTGLEGVPDRADDLERHAGPSHLLGEGVSDAG